MMVKWRVGAGGTRQAGRTFDWQVVIRAGTLLQGTQGECTARATRQGPEVEGGAAARTKKGTCQPQGGGYKCRISAHRGARRAQTPSKSAW